MLKAKMLKTSHYHFVAPENKTYLDVSDFRNSIKLWTPKHVRFLVLLKAEWVSSAIKHPQNLAFK